MATKPPVPSRANRPPLPPSRDHRPPLTPSRVGRPPLTPQDAAHDFMSDPLGFLSRNVIVVGFEAAAADMLEDKPMDLCLFTRSDNSTAKQLGNTLGLFGVGPTSFLANFPDIASRSRPFKAYFCPYRGGSTFGTTIGSNADVMFTTQMDGCSLGIGMAGGDGSRLIYHANNGGNVPKQETSLHGKFGGGGNIETIWSPKSYRMEFGESELCSTTFGLRDAATNKWSFYAQIYQRAYKRPEVFYLREVKAVL